MSADEPMVSKLRVGESRSWWTMNVKSCMPSVAKMVLVSSISPQMLISDGIE